MSDESATEEYVLTAEHELEAETGADEAPAAPLDPEVAARRRAALDHVRQWGDPVLTTKARSVDTFDDGLREEIMRMGALMNDALGIGLAATQVGILHRVLVYRVEPDSPVQALLLLWIDGGDSV